MRSFRLTVGLVALGAVAACSGSSKPSSVRAVAPVPKVAEIDAHLLTIHDLPAGWRAEPVRGPRPGDARMCNATAPPEGETERVAVFDGFSGYSQIAENLYGLASPADAAAAYAFEISHATCSNYTAPSDVITVTLKPLSLPSVGQRSRAWRATILENRLGITTTGDVILVQDGSYNLALIDRSTTGVDISLMQTTLRKALTELTS